MASSERKCGLCDKHGLLIMPVRYAIAPDTFGLPRLPASMTVEDAPHGAGKAAPGSAGKEAKQDLTLGGGAHYTARLLRSGYLYVYDEKRDRMEAYWVTQDGYYFRFPSETLVPDEARHAKPCNDNGHPELSGCIGIDNATDAGLVWLGFSDVQWTSAVIRAHRGRAGKAQRERHMRAFDAGAWARRHPTPQRNGASPQPGTAPPNAAHTVPLTALAGTVAEYAPTSAAGKHPKRFQPPLAPEFHLRSGLADKMLAACHRRSPGMTGAIVALDDPAGIAQDIAALLEWHQERLLDTHVPQDKYGKGYGYVTTYRDLVELSSAIGVLQEADAQKTAMEVVQAAPQFADHMKAADPVAREYDAMLARTPALANLPPMPGKFSKPPTPAEKAAAAARDDARRHPSGETILAAQKRSWDNYLARTVIPDPQGPFQRWLGELKAAEKILHERHLDPLARAHAAWMRSNLLANKLEFTHDGADPESGDVYTYTMHLCMAATHRFGACRDVYVNWLKGDVNDRSNVLLRALALRQDTLIHAIASAPLDSAAIPWQQLIDQFKTHVQPLLKPTTDAPLKAVAAQQAADQAKKEADDAFALYVKTVAGSRFQFLENHPLKLRADRARAAARAAQEQADEAKRNTAEKPLTDALAALISTCSAAFFTVLREFNDNAAETTLMRWMVMLGVVLRRPPTVLNVTGLARDTVKFVSDIIIDNVAKAAEKDGKPFSAEQTRQLRRHAKTQVRASFATGNIGSFETALGQTNVVSKLTVFITDEMHKDLSNIPDPTKKVTYLAEKVRSPKSLHEYGVLKVNTLLPKYGAVAEGALTAIDAMFKGLALEQILRNEAKALSFQKNWKLDFRKTVNTALFFGSVATGVANAVKIYGTWRNGYATGLTKQRAGAQMIRGASVGISALGTFTGFMFIAIAAIDFFDGMENQKNNKLLSNLQFTSAAIGAAGATASIGAAWLGGEFMIGWLSLSGWGLLLILTGVAAGLTIEKIKGDDVAQWLEHCYWGKHPYYNNHEAQIADARKLTSGHQI
ncbi:T6SS effector BTH_I2691 family protein [Burkholderia stagnalis]|uniref:T6SS effector BTH_I2691 family protein n=4 Tax=Burkholderia stagnalis TaxID=1503054 RepID=UPI00076D9949|nr:T6SS effector BTH_I2691 family protein [Burkholderia stagnalis]KVP04554.1 hypothetical protein WT20_02550 [Burkholderia stagnalis]